MVVCRVGRPTNFKGNDERDLDLLLKFSKLTIYTVCANRDARLTSVLKKGRDTRHHLFQPSPRKPWAATVYILELQTCWFDVACDDCYLSCKGTLKLN
jgi:hypothetical protein